MAANIKHLSADGATVIVQQIFPTLVSDAVEVTGTRTKFALENVSTRPLGASPFSGLFLKIESVGSNDGRNFIFTALDPNGTCSKPWGAGLDAGGVPNGSPTAVVSAAGMGGVWGALQTYGVVITATNALGETIASVQQTFTITVATQKVTYTWTQVPGATGYKVYRTATPGTYGATTLRATIVGGATTTFEDIGSATGAGIPPLTNTTGGAGPAFGTPPVIGNFAQTDLAIGVLAIGQQFFYWMVEKVPAGTSEIGNKRTARIIPREV